MWGQGAGGAQGVPGTVTPLRVCEEVYLGASVLYITQGDACWGRAAGVGDLARGTCAEWVYVCACVRPGRRVGA